MLPVPDDYLTCHNDLIDVGGGRGVANLIGTGAGGSYRI
jgi:hypothetical protein